MKDAPDFMSYLNTNCQTTFRRAFLLVKRKHGVTHRAENGVSRFTSFLWDRYACILSQLLSIHGSVYSWLLEGKEFHVSVIIKKKKRSYQNGGGVESVWVD